ncbi:MAG: hypothetical protein IT221_12025 [Fluviicola sp.]|nr:hypothetical protein [Fluviicola sp.]
MKFAALLFLFFIKFHTQGQDVLIFSKENVKPTFERVSFKLSYNKEVIDFGKSIVHQGDTFTVDACKMYISNITVLDSSFNVAYYQKGPLLIDFLKENTLFLNDLVLKKGIQINFNVGTDTLLKGMPPLSGELAAKNGMFWSWTNGFMSLKMEGKHSSSPEKQKNYVFHLGSNTQSSPPEILWQDLNSKNLVFELKELFDEHSFGAFPSLMEDNEVTYNLLKLFCDGFYAKP